MFSRFKIHQKYAGYFIAITMGIFMMSLLAGNILVWQAADSIKKRLQENDTIDYEMQKHAVMKTLAGYLSQALFNPLYQLDIEGITSLISKFKKEVHITSILIADASGKVLTDGTKENPSYGMQLKIDAANFRLSPILLSETEDVHMLTFSISIKGDIQGYGEIIFSKEPLKEHTRQQDKIVNNMWSNFRDRFLIIGFAAALGIAALAVFSSFFFSRNLSAPLIALAHASKNVADGDFSVSLPVKSMDELGILQENFNLMVKRLNHANNEIKGYAQNLEHEVILRTKELQLTLKELKDEIAIRKETEEKLKVMATTDSLTGIYNRRKFEELLEIETQRAVRYKTPLSLIEFDIDYFKDINDTHGHLAGDDVLVEITKLISENIRDIDIFARWGGEEFMIIVPHNEIEGARILAEKLRTIVEGHRITGIGAVTCSFGAAQFNEGDTFDSFIKRTDDALYDAKRSGRNKVCAA
ncbi:MAG: diguanylate cyclase [Deltaproteobacteria bacterium]|nr:diguanylate cyclase [Deltaproteobacteria bacterium]